jgi:hypothetical protein
MEGWLYRFSLERGYLDALLGRFIVSPLVRFFQFCTAVERRYCELLAGRPTPQVRDSIGSVTAFEDLA